MTTENDKTENDVTEKIETAISAWLTQNWSEVRDGALPGIRELAQQLRLILRNQKPPSEKA